MQAKKDDKYKYHMGIEMRYYPSYQQEKLVNINIGTDRFIYNRMVALNNEKYRLTKTKDVCPCDKQRLDYVNTILSNLAEFQNSIPFLNEKSIDAQCIANARMKYRKAWDNYKKNPNTGIPVFHKKGYDGSYQTNPHYYTNGGSNVHFTDKNHITIPILGRCKVKGSHKRIKEIMDRKDDIRFGTITVSRDAIGRYFISIQLKSEKPFYKELPKTGSMRGYDMNLENFYTDSDNNVIENRHFNRNLQKKLSKTQRVMSRRMEKAEKDGRKLDESKNYQKARKKAAYIHSKIKGRREDFTHVLSKKEVESQDYLFVEDLQVKNLIKNSKLSYAINEAGWKSFHKKLEYKASLYGKTFLKVPARLTTQTCSECGYVLPKGERLTLNDREWACPSCGTHHFRDHNSAKVTLFRGMAILESNA